MGDSEGAWSKDVDVSVEIRHTVTDGETDVEWMTELRSRRPHGKPGSLLLKASFIASGEVRPGVIVMRVPKVRFTEEGDGVRIQAPIELTVARDIPPAVVEGYAATLEVIMTHSWRFAYTALARAIQEPDAQGGG